MSAPTRLYTSSDVARVLGLSPAALANRAARGRLDVPEPAYCYAARGGAHRSALWTAEQIQEIADASARRARAIIEGMP